jgi:hypothetical protein
MRKIWEQLGLKPWEYEFNSIAAETGMTAHEAKNKVVMKWMQAGDFRPLVWMIKKEGMLRQPIVNLLAEMLASGQLSFKRRRGRSPDPEAGARDQFAADTYEDCSTDPELAGVGSDELFRTVGSISGVGEDSVRQAVTAKRTKSKSNSGKRR